MRFPEADPDLHLFLDDADVVTRTGLTRVVQPARRESLQPHLVGDRPWEATAICYPVMAPGPAPGEWLMWYVTIVNGLTCLARSADGRSWAKPTWEEAPHFDAQPTNIVYDRAGTGQGAQVVDVRGLDGPWPPETCYAGVTYTTQAQPPGIYAIWSADGRRWTRRGPPVLPFQGDRHSLAFDAQRRLFLLTCRRLDAARTGGDIDGRIREIALWESADLVDWHHRGVVLRADEHDLPGTELYGMTPFRYGDGFVGHLEMYYEPIEKLETQLVWSRDGRDWQRVGRAPCLGLGGQGTWDSHWVTPALNPPLVDGERLWLWYNGASTKHGSKAAHVRSIGLASLRLDGFVALETGRRGGELVTEDVRVDGPARLQVNADVRTGELAVEVLSQAGRRLDGYDIERCRVHGSDSVRLAVGWGDRDALPVTPEGAVKLRFRLRQGALFAYRIDRG